MAEGVVQYPKIQTTALWTWDTSGIPLGFGAEPIGYGARGTPTKTGLTADDLAGFIGIPILTYGNPGTPVPPQTILNWIRYAEDWVEQKTGLLLCPTWVAAPATTQSLATRATGLETANGGNSQIQGIDYDLEEAPYDFFFPRNQDEGWSYQSLRYRPVKVPPEFKSTDVMQLFDNIKTGVNNWAYIYPLLNDFFRVPPSWFVMDADFGLIRLVPAENVQMLPLFAMQLAFMGFAESIPGGLWLQYTAGLANNDYNGRYAFMKQLVLAAAAVQALLSMQISINYGATETNMTVDGLAYKTSYNKDGAFSGFIRQFMAQRDALMMEAINKVSGPIIMAL